MTYFQRRATWQRLSAASAAAQVCATVGSQARLQNLDRLRGIEPRRALQCLRQRTRQLAGNTRRTVMALLADRILAVQVTPDSVGALLALAQVIYTLFGEGTRDCRAAMAVALTYRRHARTSFAAVAARCARQDFTSDTRSLQSGSAPVQNAGPR